MVSEQQPAYLQLSSEPIRFEPVSRVTNVFFDGTTKEVVSVRGGGTLGVVVQGVNSKEAFCMEHRGNITSLKFAPDHSRLAVQRTPNSLELLSFSNEEVGAGVVVECKTKQATLLGFVWVDHDDLVLVTSHGLELYQVSRERVFVRLSRNYTLTGCCWFVWSPECRTLIVATTSTGSVGPGQIPLYPFQFGAHYSNKMPKCIVDLCSGSVDAVLCERDVCVAWVYAAAVLVLRHGAQRTAQLLVHTSIKDCVGFKLSHVCQLELSGSFAVNVIDSLIIVHHQASKISLVFDVALGSEMRDGVCYVYPVTSPASIRPYFLEEALVAPAAASSVTLSATTSSVTASLTSAPVTSSPSLTTSVTSIQGGGCVLSPPASGPTTTKIPCQLYAPTWVVFQPSVIIDARLGCLWHLQLDLPSFAASFTDHLQLVRCLLLRRHAKPLLLRTVRTITERRSLLTLGPVFDRINAGYRRHLDSVASKANVGAIAGGASTLTPPTSVLLAPPTGPCNVFAGNTPAVVVESVDLYSNVLAPMMEEAQSNSAISSQDNTNTAAATSQDNTISQLPDSAAKSIEEENKTVTKSDEDAKESMIYLVSVCLEYVRSLSGAGLPVPEFLYQLVVNALLNTGSYFKLHQLLQYHVLPDSKPLACVLLSRAGVYAACEQLSLDMLTRLHTAHEEIIEVLLANGAVTQALRYARANGLEETLSCRKFLEAAYQLGDDAVFHATFTLFVRRNTRRGSKPFTEGDHCEVFVRHYNKLYGALPDYTSLMAS